jgi:hypothetical protein
MESACAQAVLCRRGEHGFFPAEALEPPAQRRQRRNRSRQAAPGGLLGQVSAVADQASGIEAISAASSSWSAAGEEIELPVRPAR